MSVTHHLTDETIQDYAAGSLSTPMETLVACHLTVCSHCRHRVDIADNIGGALLEDSESVGISMSAIDLLARASMMPAHSAPVTTMQAPAVTGVPRPLARLLPTSLNELDWRRIAPGIKQHNLSDQHRKHGAFQLLHLEPGVELMAHSHNDRELTYLVQGSYSDEIGRFMVGDIADLDGHEEPHKPVVDSEEPCIALIATHSPVNYSGMLGKIMQPFVGI
ncbi:MAG: ChrR family anti-sigma-E factor [Granulosicoccus sp.]